MKMNKLLALLLAVVLVMSLLPVGALADDDTFIISPTAAISGESLGNVNVTGILDFRDNAFGNPDDYTSRTYSLPVYKITVDCDYKAIKIDYDRNNEYAPQLFRMKQLSDIHPTSGQILPRMNSAAPIDWQNQMTITRENYWSTDELYNAEKEKLTAYTSNNNATYLLAIYADVAEYVYNENYTFQVATASALVLFEWENESSGTGEDETARLPEIKYTVGDTEYTASAEQIGTYEKVTYFNAAGGLFLVSLPCGATVTSITDKAETYTNDPTGKIALYTKNDSTAGITPENVSENYLENEDFLSTTAGIYGTIVSHFVVDDGKSIPTSKVQGFGISCAGKFERAPDYTDGGADPYDFIIVQISTYDSVETQRIDATKLRAAIQSCSDLTNYDRTYTEASWTVYESALTAVTELLATYFGEDGEPTEENVYSQEAQTAADAAADALTAAKAALDKRADHYMTVRSQVALAEIELLAAEYDPAKLDESKYNNWQTFVDARTAALAVLAKSENVTELSESVFEAQADAMDALQSACYGLADKEGPITVHLSVTDSYAPRQGNPQPMNAATCDLELPAGATVSDALTAAHINLGRIDTFQVIGVYINGLFYIPEQASVFGGIGNYGPAGLRDGDSLTVSFYENPWEMSNDGTYRIPMALGEYMDGMRYQTIAAPATVKAGEPFTVTVTADGAMPQNYTGTATPLKGAGIYVSAASETKAVAETAKITNDADAKTGADGKATVTLYAEGWCAINAFSTETEEGKLVNGPSVLVYVEPADDLDAVKDALEAELTAAYENEKYPETYFSETDWETIQTAYGEGMTGLAAATTSGAAREAQMAALQTIRRIQTAADKSNSANLNTFARLLGLLPDDAAKLDASAESTIRSLKTCYDSMTVYQLGRLTPVQVDKYDRIMTQYAAGLPAAVSYTLTLTVDDSKVAAGDRAALADMIAYLQEHTPNCDTYSQVGGTRIAGLFSFNIPDTLAYVGTTFTEITTSPAMQTVAVCVSPDYAAYLLVRDNGGTLAAGDGSWRISDESLTMDFDDVNQVYVRSGETFTVNGTAYEVQSVTVSGLEEDAFAEHTYSYYDSSDYMGKDGVQYINMQFPAAFRRFSMPFNDVTVTVAWGPVAGTEDEISAAKETARAAINNAFARYDPDKYSAENWGALVDAKNAGLAAVTAATTLDAVAKARKDALSAMASIKKESSSTVALPDMGETIGEVYVSVRNDTFPGCVYPELRGEILAGWYPLSEQDSMMTCILKALKTEGYSWEGTGSLNGDPYGIEYLARIYRDENENGRRDADEPSLGEFDGENGSGWMGTLNDFFVNSSFADFHVDGNGFYVVENGDEISVVYTQNLGVDVGGTWGNADTSLAALVFSTGTLSPTFDGGVLSYSLVIPGVQANVKVTPTATNKNYLVKTFLNTYNKDSAYYKRTEEIPVKPGDVIYVGVGEKGWPSMNSQGAEAREYTGTKYTITVYAGGAAGVEARIEDAYKDLSKIKYSTYEKYAPIIAQLTADYDALTDKSALGNHDKLTALENKIKYYQDIDAVKDTLAKLPKSANMTDAQVTAAKAQIEAAYAAYDKLSEEQRDYITVGDAKNYNELVDRLKELTPTTSAQTIVGSDKKPEKDGNEVAPAQVVVAPEVAADGTAKAEVKAEDVSKALEEAPDAKTLTVKVETEGAASVEADLPADAVRAAADAGVGLNVETEQGTVKLSAADVKAAGGKDLAVSVKSNADGTTSFEVSAGGTAVAANVKVELPAKDGQVLVIVNADGTEEAVKKCVTSDGKVYAEIPAGAKVKVADAQGMTFGDVKETDWFAGAVEFVTSRGIFQGTGDGFQPNAPMNRAMLVTVLERIAGEKARGENTFGDVEPDDWYADAVTWASENGIVNGTDKGFEPDEPVTREQIATMLYRFMKYLGYDVSASKALSGFPDGGDASPWAKEAMEWAAGVGLFQGDQNGNLNPGGKATRAEVATLVERLIGLMVK